MDRGLKRLGYGRWVYTLAEKSIYLRTIKLRICNQSLGYPNWLFICCYTSYSNIK